MYDICASVLYKDCTTDNFASFVSGLRTNENIEHITRLHIHHKRHWAEPTYAEIAQMGWHRLHVKSTLEDAPPAASNNSMVRECKDLSQAGRRLRHFITEGLSVLPNLRVVSMGGIGEPIFNVQESKDFEKSLKSQPDGLDKIVAQALLDLPTVQHYCQSVAFGPLSLPHKVIQPLSEINTYTQHQRGRPLFCTCADCHNNCSPPIILGAINRYHSNTPNVIPYPFTSELADLMSTFLDPIIAMFSRQDVIIADPVTGKPVPCRSDKYAELVKQTKIEIYNHVRIYDLAFARTMLKFLHQYPDMIHTLPALSLSNVQSTLDAALPKRWRGRVILKDREVAPPCIACGFDFQKEFKIAVEGWMSSPHPRVVATCEHLRV